MATYFVASGGSNTAPYDTWAKAATSLQTALTAASSGTDIVVIQYDAIPTANKEQSADTTYIVPNNISIISASNDGGSSYTPTAMGTAQWIGNSTASRWVGLSGAYRIYVYGVTFRLAGASAVDIYAGNADGQHIEYDNCYLWCGTTSSSARIRLGASNSGFQIYFKLKDTTLRFGSTSQGALVMGNVDMEGCTVSSAGSAPTSFIKWDVNGGNVNIFGSDLSHLGANTIVQNSLETQGTVTLWQCKLGSSYVLSSITSPPNLASLRAQAFDCSSGDTHGIIHYANALGSVVSDAGIYFTSGAAGQSWKIVTTANCSYWTPFCAPWVNLYNTGTSAITPYFEVLRDGSATAYQDDEIWAEFATKVTASSTLATFYRDRKAITAAAADQAAGAGTGSWTGENATAWSGKCDSGGSLTPAEAGHIRGRLVVGEPSITVYLDPQIRT